MWLKKAIAVGVMAVAAVLVGPADGQDTVDPHDVLARYFAACGGLDRLRAERSTYFEGTLSVGGMQGPVKEWTEKPDRRRTELDLGVLRITEGDNGEVSWILDSNGKLQKITKPDEAQIRRREVRRRMADYEYADPGSAVFTVSFEGIENVDGTDCYAIRITNSINVDHTTYYIGVEDSRLRKRIAIEGEESADTVFDDYREVDGILVPFLRREVPHQTGQPYEVVLNTYESNPSIEPSRFDPPAAGEKDYEITDPDAMASIPLRLIGNHLFLPATVAGRERLWILDSGAGMTVVTKAFADEVGLELEGDLKGRGAGGTVDASFARLPSLRVGGVRFESQTVAVIEMQELVRRLGVEVAGILGYDFLSRFVTMVDYANEQVTFYEPESFHYTGDGHVLDAHMKQGTFESTATLDGRHSGTWLFDLGAGTTHLDGIYALREGYARRKGVLGRGHGAGNEYTLKSVQCDSMQFAGFTVYEPRVSFHYGGSDTVFTADKIGVLGNSLFRNFVLYLDYARERVIVEKGERFNAPWPEDRSGLGIAWTPDRRQIEVLYVSPDTPAARAGFEEGDILVSINDISVEQLQGVVAVRELLKRPAGTKYDCVVDRGGRERRIRMKLADLY